MKYLIISPLSLSFFTIPRLNQAKDVEKIYFCYPKLDDKSLGKDITTLPDWSKLEMITDYTYALNRCSKEELVVVIDDVSMGETGKNLSDQGWNVIGGKPITDRIEKDRQFATDLMKRVMNVPESVSFTSWDRAIEFVKTNEPDDRLVFKPNDADALKEYTYIATDVADMVENMKLFREDWKWKEDFQIQRFVTGVEVDFSAYFNGKDWLPNSLMIYFENKPFMNDDVGVATGGSIAVQFARPVEGVFADILEKLKPMLTKAGYKGQLAINSIVSDKDKLPYFLEFCGRFGYPSLPLDITLLEAKGKTYHDLLKALAYGETPSLFATDRIAAVVAVSVPPFPGKQGVEDIRGKSLEWDRKYDTYFFPTGVMVEKNKLVLAGTDTEVLYVTCESENLAGTTEMLYDVYMKTLKLKGAQYRTDCGKSARECMQKLKEYGLI